MFQRGVDGRLHPIAGWRTTGPFDFDTWSHNIDWNGVGQDLATIADGVFSFVDPAAAPEANEGILGSLLRRRVGDNIQGHHSFPRFLGGADDQELVEMPRDFHRLFHRQLTTSLRKAGYPPVGGTNGTKEIWWDLFDKNPVARQWAEEILRRQSRDFDIERGTSLRPALEKTFKARVRTPRPQEPSD